MRRTPKIHIEDEGTNTVTCRSVPYDAGYQHITLEEFGRRFSSMTGSEEERFCATCLARAVARLARRK